MSEWQSMAVRRLCRGLSRIFLLFPTCSAQLVELSMRNQSLSVSNVARPSSLGWMCAVSTTTAPCTRLPWSSAASRKSVSLDLTRTPLLRVQLDVPSRHHIATTAVDTALFRSEAFWRDLLSYLTSCTGCPGRSDQVDSGR